MGEIVETETVIHQGAAEEQHQGMIRKEGTQQQQQQQQQQPNAFSASPMLACLLTDDLNPGVPVALPVGLPGSPDDANLIPDSGVSGAQLIAKEGPRVAPIR